MNVVDLPQIPDPEREQHLQQLIQQEAITPFDLEIAPLIRASLFQLSAREYVLLITMHHIVSDGWSIGVFSSELSVLYQAFSRGEVSPLPALAIQYADFTWWQREWLSGRKLENQLNYWNQQLMGANPILELPTDYLRPPVQTFSGANQSLLLNQELITAIKTLSYQQGVTLFMILLAAFQVLLYRYSGQEDIIVGFPVAGRNRAEVENMIGFFINTLVLRTKLVGNPSFLELLKQVYQAALDAYLYQDMPFEKIVQSLKLKPDLSRNPLFQVCFNMLNLEDIKLELPSMAVATINMPKTNTKFDIDLYLQEQNDGVKLDLTYNSDLFKPERMKEMLHQFQHLLEQIVVNPEVKIAEISLVTQRAELLLPNPRQLLSKNLTLPGHIGFWQQAQKLPDQIAIVDAQVRWTYAELEERSNLLADYLLVNQIKSQDIVAIYGHRSAGLVWAILGILKAGAAFVILDPAYPSFRLIDCLEVAQPRAWLQISIAGAITDSLQDYLETLALKCNLQLPQGSIAEIRHLFSDYVPSNPEIVVEPDQLAYIAFTSGSSGKPKGILGTHRPLSHFIQWHCQTFGLKESDRFSMLSGLSHDPLLRDIFTPLSLGATLCIPQSLDIETPEQLANWLKEQQITITHLTPALAQLLLIGNPIEPTLYLRYIFFGGDVLKMPDVLNIKDFAPHATCINFYGATETPQVMSYFIIPDSSNQVDLNRKNIPLGRGIENVQLLILNNQQNLAGIGELGEIYVRTPYLSKGYIGSNELNEERFIINPITEIPDDKLYKTGDLARYLADGNIEYFGRIDNQVKIRGFRIELGEIEAVLNTHAQIQQAVVMPREDVPGDKRLVAYIVTSDESLTSHQLREFLKQKLPEYMVPSAWVMLDKLPLTPNGKIDRQALPAPDGEITRTDQYVAPRTPREEIIANIFAQVLNVQNVGIDHNFFELGGHSLLATQLVSRLRRAFGVEIPLRAIFAAPTVVELNQTLTQLSNQGSGLGLPPIQPREEREELPLSWAQEGLWFLNQLEGASATYNMPGAVRITGDLDINVLQQALAEIVRRHEVLRTSFATVNGQPVQVIDSAATINIKVVDLPQLPDAEGEQHLQQLIQQEAHTPFDLEIAPLIRSSLLRLSATEYVLLLTMYHIVSDGWSIGIFSSELSSLYQAFSRGEASPLPALAIQYADFTVWQREWLSGEILATQLNYWRSQLKDAPSLLQLPTDRPRPSVQTYRGSTQTFSLNPDLTKQLQTRSRASGTTLFMTLVATFATLLHRYSGESDILIGTPIANRNREEIEGLIGFFVNTLVLRTQVENNPSFEELLTQVRETTLQAYQHQDVPFEQVVEALQPERSLSHSPLFQVTFVFQNTPMRDLELPGVVVAQLSTESTIAKFDLTLSMTESESGLVGEWEYNTDLFDDTTIERMATHFQNLLLAIAENPHQRVGEIPLLSAAERHQLLVEWNDTATEYPRDKCIHQLFEEQVEKTPLAVAVVFENQQLTYQELNQKSNQLAHYLQGLGVGLEVLVGICVERSPSMVVGLLGILKAGGAYVPLDPNYPQERLSYMLADSGVGVLLTQQSLLASLPSHSAQIVGLDTDWEAIAQASQENLDAGVGAENLAYVIYTSGSTGLPKGVAIEHQSPVALGYWARQTFTTAQLSGVLASTSICFDLSVFELFVTLFMGGKIILVRSCSGSNQSESSSRNNFN